MTFTQNLTSFCLWLSITIEVQDTKPKNVLESVSVITKSNPYQFEWPQPLISIRNFILKISQLFCLPSL